MATSLFTGKKDLTGFFFDLSISSIVAVF